MDRFSDIEMHDLMRIKRKLMSYQDDFKEFCFRYCINTSDSKKTEEMFEDRLCEISLVLEQYRIQLEQLDEKSQNEKTVKRKNRGNK